ncbi:MAG TPA: DM13 domain-containing protein [Candidatus Thermoplasmatota archaeon]|jgi:hypothetical protein|nr:DM13 domain-containing protein [Candidatus Thermoplasmatota archaeon]
MQQRKLVLLAVAGVVVVVAAAVGFVYLAPKGSTTVAQELPAGAMMGSEARGGTLRDGAALHHSEGSVKLLEGQDGWFLRFEDYDATSGPDVYFYLTRGTSDWSAAEVEGNGVRVPVPGGAADGQATLRGDFNVPLAGGVDPAQYRGLAVWCRNFDTLFGYAALA